MTRLTLGNLDHLEHHQRGKAQTERGKSVFFPYHPIYYMPVQVASGELIPFIDIKPVLLLHSSHGLGLEVALSHSGDLTYDA